MVQCMIRFIFYAILGAAVGDGYLQHQWLLLALALMPSTRTMYMPAPPEVAAAVTERLESLGFRQSVC